MAAQTENLNLTKPDGTDPVDIAPINGNMDIIDGAYGGIMGRFGGMSFRRLSRAEYDALTVKDSGTAYFTTDIKGKVELFVGEANIGGGNGEPLNAAILLSRSGAALSADAEAVTPDEPAIQTMIITGFTNGAGTSGQGSYSNRIITQDYYTFPAANILTLSGTKPSGKSLWFEYDYYSYANYSIGYWHGITEDQQVNMSSVQSWWPNYQISKFKLVVGFTDNSAISPSDVTIQMNYKGY